MATSLASTVAGTVLKVSAAAPATYDATGFAAVVYSTVGEITDMGSLGKTYTVINHNPVNTRSTYKYKGSYDNGSLQLKLAKAVTDVGQVVLKASLNSDADYTFQIVFPDASKMYFVGKVSAFTTMIGTVNNILGADAKVEVSGDIIESAT